MYRNNYLELGTCMKIVVYDVAAEDGGGLFVLKDFYNEVLNHNDGIEWHFFVSTKEIKSNKNIIVHYYPKKNIINRMLSEQIQISKMISSISPNLVVSLQNMPLVFCKYKQVVYLHQSLQYCPVSFSFFHRSERKLAIKQHIVCNIYRLFLHKAKHIYVQTNWIKKATIKWLNCKKSKISVVPVTIQKNEFQNLKYDGFNSHTFFYPARAQQYKNHIVVIKAVKLLVKKGVKNFKVIFTIDPKENKYAKVLKDKSKGLPIDFVGTLPYEQVWKEYSKSIMIFPSYLETCGLPLLEAKSMRSIIIASDLPFSHEALLNYSNALFFKFDDSSMLSEQMERVLNGTYMYIAQPKNEVEKKNNLYSQVLEIEFMESNRR